MSQYNLDEGGQVCEDCGLEDVELFGGLCEDCDNEMFATFWTGETDEQNRENFKSNDRGFGFSNNKS